MIRKTHCKVCKEFFKYNGKYCSMSCALKKKTKIYPKRYSMDDIKKCLENNMGVRISLSTIVKYSKEIKKFLTN